MVVTVIDLARCLAATSPAFGSTLTAPTAFLQACDWAQPWQTTKPRETNTLLALRGMANMFLTANGRRTMCNMAEETLKTLAGGRTWEELGARKLPFATIALS